MNKKKVVFLCQRWTSGGIESLVNKILQVISKDNYEFEIAVFQKESDVFDAELNKNNIKIIQLNDRCEKNPLIRNIKAFSRLAIYLKNSKPDIIHINLYNSMSNIYGNVARKCKVSKIILHAHNNGFDKDPMKIKLLLNNICKRIFYNKSYTYLACSEEAADFCFNKKTKNDCQIINNGINVKDFIYNEETRNSYRKKFKIEDSYVVGNIGRFVEQKNQLRLISIFYEIKKIVSNSKLILIGDGCLEKDILNSIAQKELNDDVIILKNRNDVNNILQTMDCFVFPSLYEGYGIVAIEAQASGLPTFISNKLSKQIFASENAFEIDLNDTNKQIAKFIVDKTKQTKRKSPEMNEFDIQNMVEKIMKCYSK